MKKIERIYDLDKLFMSGRIVVLYGPRRVGKTTLVKDYLARVKTRWLFEVGDSLPFQKLMMSLDPQVYRNYFGDYELVVIDEAQLIPKVGRSLKLLIDIMLDLKVIVTGSSSFELSGQVGEPLTGRKIEVVLYPISHVELAKQWTRKELMEKRDEFLVYGMYPEVITAKRLRDKEIILRELVGSYLMKDVLVLQDLQNPQMLWDLLKLLAFQVGSEVSLRELGSQLGVNYKTVARYLNLLEKSFVVFAVGGYSRNLRKEVVKRKKYYFYDLGVRNAVIERFQRVGLRDDVGQLWENFVMVERRKKLAYEGKWPSLYFWRTWDGQEVDLVEERGGKLYGYELKWSEKKKAKPPKDWLTTYPEASWEVINRENYLKWVK